MDPRRVQVQKPRFNAVNAKKLPAGKQSVKVKRVQVRGPAWAMGFVVSSSWRPVETGTPGKAR